MPKTKKEPYFTRLQIETEFPFLAAVDWSNLLKKSKVSPAGAEIINGRNRFFYHDTDKIKLIEAAKKDMRCEKNFKEVTHAGK